jgi:hypothetical protein
MSRRFLAVLFVVLAALAALAILLTLTTRGEEPLSDTALQPSQQQAAGREAEQPKFQSDRAAPGGEAASPSDPAGADGASAAPQSLASSGTVRVEVHETAQRASDVFAQLQADGAEQPAFTATVADFKEWSGVPAGKWQLKLTGLGWAADPDHFELVAGQRQIVQVTARNRASGLMVERRTGRPVTRATLTPQFFHRGSEDSAAEPYTETPPLDVTAPDGHFALAGFNMPTGPNEFRSLILDGTAEGLLEGRSEPLAMQPEPFWTGIVIAFPEPVLRGHVRGTDPELGDVPVPGADVQLVPVNFSLDKPLFISGVASWSDQDLQPLATTTADVEGAFAFGPVSRAGTVLQARLLVTAWQWRPLLSEPIEIDQLVAPRSVELRLQRGGRLHATLHVPLQPATSSAPRQPVMQPTDMSLTWLDPPAGATVPHCGAMPMKVEPSGDPEAALFIFDEGGLPSGRWRLDVTLSPADSDRGSNLGLQSIITEVQIVDGQRTDVVLELPSDKGGLKVTGTVHLPEDFAPDLFEAALAGAPHDGKLPAPTVYGPVSADGHFELPDAPAGDWTLVISASTSGRRDIAFVAAFVHVGTTSPPPVHLDLTRPVVEIQAGPQTRGHRLTLGGRCGDPVLDAAIAAGNLAVRPDTNGVARIFGLLPARWTLTAESDPPAQVDFELTSGAGVVRVELP